MLDHRPSPTRRSTSPASQMSPAQPSPLSTTAGADSLHPREAERPVSMALSWERGRKKRAKTPHETLIFVRPPPTGKAPGMNVQVQLVAPGAGRNRAASDTSYHSTASLAPPSTGGDDLEEPRCSYAPSESAEPEPMESLTPPSAQEPVGGLGRPLSRSSSIKSNNSTASNATGASSSKRRIVPLYNLNYHTVLTTAITDAGTDARVSKFLKRTIEIVGVGELQPYEQWSSVAFSVESSPSSLRNNISLPPNPTSPRMSLDAVFNRKPLEEAIGVEPRKLFGKFWSKKEKPATSIGTTSDFSFFRSAGGGGGFFGLKQTPALTASPTTIPPTLPEGLPASPSTFPLSRESTNTDPLHPQPFIGAPTLGTSPTVRPSAERKVTGARPSAYVWTVNKWASPSDAWSFASLADSLSPPVASSTTPSSSPPTSVAPSVRFEWVREAARPSRSAPSSTADVPRRVPGTGEARSASRPRQLTVGEVRDGSRPNSPRPSQDGVDESEEEEDPEDSEVPWHCWVKDSLGASSFLGTLSPAPHHPKVLAQLRTAYPMPPFALVGLKDRESISSDGLKDVLVSSAMYLLFREEWGGIGRKGGKKA